MSFDSDPLVGAHVVQGKQPFVLLSSVFPKHPSFRVCSALSRVYIPKTCVQSEHCLLCQYVAAPIRLCSVSLFIRLNIGAYVSRSSPHSYLYHGERLCSVSLFIRLNIGAYVSRSSPHSYLHHGERLCSVSLFLRLNIGAYVSRSSPHSYLYHGERLCSVSLFIRLNIGAYVPRSPPHSCLYTTVKGCVLCLCSYVWTLVLTSQGLLPIPVSIPRWKVVFCVSVHTSEHWCLRLKVPSPFLSLHHGERLCSVSLFIRLNIGAYVPRSPPHSYLYHGERLCSVSLFLCMNISTYVRKPPPPLDEYHTTNSHSYSEVRYLSELSFFVFLSD